MGASTAPTTPDRSGSGRSFTTVASSGRTVPRRTGPRKHTIGLLLLAACAEEPAPIDACEALPAPPLVGRRLDLPATEDLDFDDYGHLVGSDYHSLIWSRRDGARGPVIPGIETPAGLRFLADDSLVVAAVTTGQVLRLFPDGGRISLLDGLNWPNGLAIAPDGRVMVAELSGGRVWAVGPSGEAPEVLATIERPNGLWADDDALLVSTMTGEGTIWRVPFAGGAPERAWDGIGAGHLDGLARDACGHLYVADYEGHRLLRLREDGGEEVLIDRTDDGSFLPGLRFGSGRGGFEADRLYLPEPDTRTVWELEVGVGAARR